MALRYTFTGVITKESISYRADSGRPEPLQDMSQRQARDG